MARYKPVRRSLSLDSEESGVDDLLSPDEIWSIWCSVTSRESCPTPPGIDAMPSSDASYMIRLAAHTSPRGDSVDAERLIRILTDENARNAAASNIVAGDGVVPYPGDGVSQRYEKLAVSLGISDDQLSERDKRTLYRIAADPRRGRIDALADQVSSISALANHISDSRMFPSVSLENRATLSSFIRGPKLPADGYKAGRKEEKILLEEEIEADLDASMMIAHGYTEAEMKAYHDQVPLGYWTSVVTHLRNPTYGGDVEIIYKELEREWNFHPDQRQMPMLGEA